MRSLLFEKIAGMFRKHGKLPPGQVSKPVIESLLHREEINFQNEQTASCFGESAVLVTGAAGSIGSEICRQVSGYCQRIVLMDQAESGLYDIDFELRGIDHQPDICLEVASVRDRKRMEDIFARYRPDYVFHAAAYKHVPIMEYFPTEAVLTNVLGTRILADNAIKYKARKFIMISTDKAVHPVNIMGATKCIAEMYIQSLGSGQTRFITTRFGNVLGSNGSVVPLFNKQISRGGPVTITHPDIKRFFMTIPEAGRLVMEACVMGEGGEIFVFNMGKPVGILEMARKMIQLAANGTKGKIPIQFIGLRPGEKMQEQLFKDSEDLVATHHPEIMMTRAPEIDLALFHSQLDELIEYATQHHQVCTRNLLKKMLPDFKE